jgi:hypothetical protein
LIEGLEKINSLIPSTHINGYGVICTQGWSGKVVLGHRKDSLELDSAIGIKNIDSHEPGTVHVGFYVDGVL